MRSYRESIPNYPSAKYKIGDRVKISSECNFSEDYKGEVMVVIGMSAKRCPLRGYDKPEITYHISTPITRDGKWYSRDGGSDEWEESDLTPG